MGGGIVSSSLSQATHLVIQSLGFVDVGIAAALNSFSTAEVHLVCNKRMHVVGSQWLEDSIENNQRLREDTYSIKLEGLEDLNAGECNNELKPEDELDIDDVGKQNLLHSAAKDEIHRKRKAIAVDSSSDAPRKKYSMKRRGRPASTSRKDKKAGKSQPLRLRARIGNKPAKICESESDVDACSEDTGKKEESVIGREIHEVDDLVDKKDHSDAVGEMGEFSELSQRGKVVENKDKWVDSVHGTGMEESSIGTNEKIEKLEMMVDPVQSMLLDMIPSLGTQTSAVTESKQQPSDPNQVPAKKKKVSYKDIAYELLRD